MPLERVLLSLTLLSLLEKNKHHVAKARAHLALRSLILRPWLEVSVLLAMGVRLDLSRVGSSRRGARCSTLLQLIAAYQPHKKDSSSPTPRLTPNQRAPKYSDFEWHTLLATPRSQARAITDSKSDIIPATSRPTSTSPVRN